ncbi:hypothetical protein BDA96_09G221500 [Sorghum bicolor]|uniref:F-box domain-containing protein n=3 Tax=Sorghum bicolor TaxID=4558 RepID=A0A1Z5R4I8_SORBI|nr:hypothetical protein BDA96_09G221500 [Sorghum bicolor]OQU78345.1 hypothetical protein SORBI_3009G209800 [Sorghum bicolor]
MELQNEDGRRKRRRISPPNQNPELSEEIIVEEILVRLPVKSLVRFKSVCKAWRATISDPIFIRAHLRHSATKQEQDPCVIISPLIMDNVIPGESRPSTFSNQFRFYQWHHLQANGGSTPSSKQTATHIYTKDLGSGEVIRQMGYFAFCDGLVLVRTDTKLYLLNPATRDSLTLPDNKRNKLGREFCNSAGLGLDPRSGKYKVVRAFYRSLDITTNAYGMGMEVFTVGAGRRRAWRKIAHDVPYPVCRQQSSLSVKGLMFWRIDKVRHGHHQTPPRGLLHLNLADESFGVTRLPDSMDPALDDTFFMDMLHGELWLTACTSRTPDTLTIWAMPVDDNGGQGQWEQRYSIVGYPLIFRPLALLPGSGDGSSQVLFWNRLRLYSYDLATSMLTIECELDRMRYQGRKARKWKNLCKFTARLYTESLVPLTAY